MNKEIIIIAEIQNNKVSPITFELATLAGELASVCTTSVKIIVINQRALHYADEITLKTGFDVIAVTTSQLEYYNGASFKKIIKNILNGLNPLYICIGHTSQGQDFAPGLAISINSPCISGISGYDRNGEDLIFVRSVYGGKINAYIKPLSDAVVLTLQPGIFRKDLTNKEKGTITEYTSDEIATGSMTTGIRTPASDPAALTTAKTVIAVGRGIEAPENIIFAEKFSQHFNNAAIACSRPVVDLGWMKYKYQVGITGAVISPEIYISGGISGSTQHIAGMRGAELVISINSDPNASIFNVSDICIVDDMLDFFKAFGDFVNNLK